MMSRCFVAGGAMAAVLALFAPGVRERPLHAQDAGAPSFEVASVRPNTSGDGRVMVGFQPGGRYTATNITARISSVVLSGQRVPLGDVLYTVQQKVAADAVDPLVYNGEKLIPSVTRVFSRSRDLHVFLQAYERTATTTQPLVAFVSFYQGR